MDELVLGDHDPDVRGPASAGSEEHQVTGAERVSSDLRSEPVLLGHGAGNNGSMAPKHEGDQTATVEPGRIGAAVAVG